VESDRKALVSPRNARPTQEVARLDRQRKLGFRVSDFFRASDFEFRICAPDDPQVPLEIAKSLRAQELTFRIKTLQ
jgi:hypothetical protein